MSVGIVVVGGKLQGVEALYLADKAGIAATLVDKNPACLGRGMCGAFLCADVLHADEPLISLLRAADFILPALENADALDALAGLQAKYGLNVGFDRRAYAVTSSKIASNELMKSCGVETPAEKASDRPPYIAKPSAGSGSDGVTYIADEEQWRAFTQNTADAGDWVIQPFIPGRQYSVEVVGEPGRYRVFETTELFVDEGYDCKRVEAPCGLPAAMRAQLENIAVTLAEALALKGVMDVEAIDDGGVFRVLEIDARLPSQTPTAVYHATGVNLLVELMRVYCGEVVPPPGLPLPAKRHVSYEHFLVEDGEIKEVGEHIMGECGPLTTRAGFLDGDEALTDYRQGIGALRATFINTADSREDLLKKRERVRTAILRMKESD